MVVAIEMYWHFITCHFAMSLQLIMHVASIDTALPVLVLN